MNGEKQPIASRVEQIDGLKVNVTFRCFQINKNKYVNKNVKKRNQKGFDEIFHFKQLVELV